MHTMLEEAISIIGIPSTPLFLIPRIKLIDNFPIASPILVKSLVLIPYK